ncbi:DUF348 domain-containing protein [Clostridium tarantellae]|uniref:DUF348 domain-containing protein n=1 Tax=Clostridium tarantellae TaxID=39493 RepID=A0A6I1MJ83_9CLOT|nr:DUF348 domain-containing protein [Clostridium tarantellae]
MTKKLKDYFSRKKINKKIFITSALLLIIGASLGLSFKKTIIVVVDGEERKVTTYKGTVQGALHDQKLFLAPKDKVEPELDSKISNNDTIKINRAVNLTVNVDGKKLNLVSAEDTVKNMIASEGISLNKDDKVLPSLDEKLEDGVSVEIIRVDVKEVKEILPIAHETSITHDDTLLDTYTKVLKEGKDGEKEVINKVVFENGKEVSKTVLSESVKTEPIAKEVVQGTLKTLSVNRGGNAINYKKQLTNVKATAYSPINGAKTAYTASGMKATRNPNGYSTIAVDPSIIPLGTKVYVEGYGYAIAADTGSNVKGNFIDVFFNEFKEACNWGVKYLNVYILE